MTENKLLLPEGDKQVCSERVGFNVTMGLNDNYGETLIVQG